MFSLWYSIVASQLLYIRLHECCKQLKRPVAVIPQCSYPETLSLETAGMSSFSLSLSLLFFFASNFLSCWFHSLFVCLFHFLSVRSWHVQAEPHSTLCLSCRSLSRMHTHAEWERADPGVMHTDMTICHWHRGQCKQWERCMWQNEKAQRGSETPPAFCSLLLPHIHISPHINTYTRLCCHDSRVSLIWA